MVNNLTVNLHFMTDTVSKSWKMDQINPIFANFCPVLCQ